jgi:Trypsin-like peptidase domain
MVGREESLSMKSGLKKASVPDPIAQPVTGLGLRIGDQETARVVAVHRESGEIVGAGCLIDDRYVLTCRHVVEAARDDVRDLEVFLTLAGVKGRPTVTAEVVVVGGDGPENDLALLEIVDAPSLSVKPVEFASPLRHGGKAYSVLGFPGGDQQGRNATGFLHATDAIGLVQMDRGGALSVLGGFSGAPVWSSDVNAFVGLVVTELANDGVSWCIPSRLLSQFYPNLLVRFRVPLTDRPQIHDYRKDDPNGQIFGTVSDNGERRLTAKVAWRKVKKTRNPFVVTAVYEVLAGAPEPCGNYVTFITYPDFRSETEDSYELFAEMKNGRAEVKFFLSDSFTIAAIGDAGGTALTLDLAALKNNPSKFW